jgi:LacI family transcriptional regulator
MVDVARRAGVSQPTVSAVLNNTPYARVADDTRQRVIRAAAELNYRPDATAQSLRRGTSQLLGFVTDAVAITPFAGDMIKGAHESALRHRNLVLVANTEGDHDAEKTAIEVMLEHRVTGIIYSSWYHHEVEPPAVLREVPSVLLNCYAADASLPAIVPDELNGGRNATELLIRNGHHRVAFINSVPHSQEIDNYRRPPPPKDRATASKRVRATTEPPAPATFGRLAGYREALAAAGTPFDETLVHTVEPIQEGGYSATTRLLDHTDPPTAIFCYNDRVAMGAYAAILERGLKIPADVAVIGFDNQEVIAAHLRPPLTTMALPHYQLGVRGAQYLLTRGQPGGWPEPIHEQLRCELVRRTSA